MSGPDLRLQTKENYDLRDVLLEAQVELDRMKALAQSISETIAKGHETIRDSQDLIERISKW
jgi:hypothetical protein